MIYRIFTIMLLISNFTFAQKTMTYEQCINYAKKHNLNFNKSKIDITKKKLDYTNELINFLPDVNIRSQYEINKGKSVDPETNDITTNEYFRNNYSINSSVYIFNGFLNHNRLSFQKYLLKAEKSNIQKLENDLSFSVIEVYGELLLNIGLEKIHKEQYEISAKELLKKEQMYKFGKAAKTDIYESRARLASDKYQKIYYSGLAELSKLKLKQIMHYPIDSVIHIQDINIGNQSNIDTVNMYEKAMQNLPEIKTINNRLEAAKRKVRIETASLMPSLSAFYNVNTGYYETTRDKTGKTIAFSDQFSDNKNTSYGLSLRIPITGILGSRNRLKRAKFEYHQEKMNFENRKREIEYELLEAKQTLISSNQEYISMKDYSQTQELAFQAAQKKIDNGMISMMDYYESKNKFAKAKSDELRTMIQLFLKQVTVRYYLTGKVL